MVTAISVQVCKMEIIIENFLGRDWVCPRNDAEKIFLISRKKDQFIDGKFYLDRFNSFRDIVTFINLVFAKYRTIQLILYFLLPFMFISKRDYCYTSSMIVT